MLAASSIVTISEKLDCEEEDYEPQNRDFDNSFTKQRRATHAAALRPSISSAEKKDLNDSSLGNSNRLSGPVFPPLVAQRTQRTELKQKEQLSVTPLMKRRAEKYGRLSAMGQPRPSVMLKKREKIQLSTIYQT